ncbi:MAG: transglycosylase domain-containing protein [Patescibacteria group bacterium]
MSLPVKNKRFYQVLKISGVLFIIFLATLVWGLFEMAKIAKSLPNPEKAVAWQVAQSTKIYDRTGKVLLYEISGQGRRTVLSSTDIPDNMRNATIAAEDQNFYKHAGLDWKGIARAFFMNILKGEIVQGGSTITQQLAKNAFLSNEKTFQRKIKELILTYWIEKYYSKDDILNLYLNQISYGSNTYGIESASQLYLAKSAKNLTLAEAATMAVLPKSPPYYSPWGTHINELLARKNHILDQMQKVGFISEQEKELAQKTTPKFTQQNLGSIKAPHFVMMVKDYLIDKYGEEALNTNGFDVVTTLDWNLQQTAEKVVKEGASRNAELYKGKNAALVAEDPKTGQLLALVGSANYFDKSIDGNFNVANQGLRQPGSSIKPLVYATAFKEGYSPDTVVFDLPTEFLSNNPSCPLLNINYQTNNLPCYHPQNYDHIFRGPVNLRSALAQSINVPAVKVLYLAGLNNVIKTAEDFGVTTLNDADRIGLSLVLGGGEVKLTELVGAYSVFAQEGMRHQQAIILNIKDSRGRIMESFVDRPTQAIDSQYARLINDILSDNDARRPLYQSSFDLTTFDDREVALKTGTTNDYVDAWTFGYTPSLVVGVWAGNNHRESMQKSAGSILAALPIWSSFMKQVINKFPNEPFNNPDPITQPKPMLNGQYNTGSQIHDILFYVNKNDPLGPPPANPTDDPQFLNWEAPVRFWTQQNILTL